MAINALGVEMDLPDTENVTALKPISTGFQTAPVGTEGKAATTPISAPATGTEGKSTVNPLSTSSIFGYNMEAAPPPVQPVSTGTETKVEAPKPITTAKIETAVPTVAKVPAPTTVMGTPATGTETKTPLKPTATTVSIDKEAVAKIEKEQAAKDLIAQNQVTLNNIQQLMGDYALGRISDPVYNKAFNQAIANIGMMNAEDMAALQQRIAADPNLKGTGLGYGMLAMQAAANGKTMADEISRLTVDSAQRLMDLQKYGIQNFQSMEKEQYDRKWESAQSLIDHGNFTDGAKALGELLSTSLGYEIKIDPNTLKSRDSTSINNMETQLNLAKTLATNGQDAAALPILQAVILANPDIFKGVTAESLIEAWKTGATTRNIEAVQGINTEINTIAAAGGTFDDVKYLLESLEKQSGRDFTVEGKKLSLDQINTLRKELYGPNTPILTQRPDGTIGENVNDQFIPIDDDDYWEIGAMAEFNDRATDAGKETYENKIYKIALDQLGEEMLSDPGINDAVWSIIRAAPYKINPETGEPEPTLDFNFSSITSDPMYKHLFFKWPLANFDEATGNIIGSPTMYDMPYSADNPQTQDDSELDKKYNSYAKYTDNPLDPFAWFFATAGGKRPVDTTKIGVYEAIKNGTFTGNVNNPSQVTATGTETMAPVTATTTVTMRPPEELFNEEITKNPSLLTNATPEQIDSLTPETISALTPEQLGVLTAEQATQILNSDKTSRMNMQQLNALQNVVDKDVLAKLGTPDTPATDEIIGWLEGTVSGRPYPFKLSGYGYSEDLITDLEKYSMDYTSGKTIPEGKDAYKSIFPILQAEAWDYQSPQITGPFEGNIALVDKAREKEVSYTWAVLGKLITNGGMDRQTAYNVACNLLGKKVVDNGITGIQMLNNMSITKTPLTVEQFLAG